MKNIKKISLLTLSTLIISSVMIGVDLKSIIEDNINIDVNKYNSFNELVVNNDTEPNLKEPEEVTSDIKKDNTKEIVSDSKIVSTKDETSDSIATSKETVEDTKEEVTQPIEGIKKDNEESLSNIEKYEGNISGYGHDCYGCTSGRTAAGIDINDGHIFYDDSEYGRVRMVAGDKKYPFGTIVKITNFMGLEPFYAIVEDRGGAIGIDKNIQFDLLYPQNSDAINVGIQKNVTFEIMRLGY